MDEQPPNNSTGSGPGATAMQNNSDTLTRYAFTWRSQGLGSDAKNIDDLIAALDDGAGALRLLKESGIQLDTAKSADGDVCLVTTDPAVASKFGFEAEAAITQVAKGEASAGNVTDAKLGE
jgi:hypothetical protein